MSEDGREYSPISKSRQAVIFATLTKRNPIAVFLMSLAFTFPEESLARELREVARAAAALREALTKGVNFKFPGDFPREQIVQICLTLERLAEGTAEGCRTPLEYSRNRLPAIRRAYVLSAESISSDSDVPSVLRGENIDQKLSDLIASVTTALDEYRRLASEEGADETIPTREVETSAQVTADTLSRARSTQTKLAAFKNELEENYQIESSRAADFNRQVSDAVGLNRLATVELTMQRVAIRWFRNVAQALSNYPDLIRRTAGTLKVGADIVEIGLQRWHKFEQHFTSFLIVNLK